VRNKVEEESNLTIAVQVTRGGCAASPQTNRYNVGAKTRHDDECGHGRRIELHRKLPISNDHYHRISTKDGHDLIVDEPDYLACNTSILLALLRLPNLLDLGESREAEPRESYFFQRKLKIHFSGIHGSHDKYSSNRVCCTAKSRAFACHRIILLGSACRNYSLQHSGVPEGTTANPWHAPTIGIGHGPE
jgi:hypothetical protein